VRIAKLGFKLGFKQSPGLLLAALILVACSPTFAMRHASARHLHQVKGRHGRFRRIFWDPVFRPSHDSLLRQNAEIDRMDLPRIQNDEELERYKASGDLVSINASEALRFDPRLAEDRRYCRPWTRDFVEDLSQAYYKQFHEQIQVNSAVRTVQIQKKLRRHNRNAAPERGDTASSHLAGITVDLQRRGMTKAQVKWMEQYLLPLRDAGLVEPEEERHQWVFHIALSGRYADWRADKDAVANGNQMNDSNSSSQDSSFSWEQTSWDEDASILREP
jgi:uncharacterized protein YcbK (DUF882 family)